MSGEKPEFGWGHININVRDLDRSIAFYEKLGFEIFIPGIPYPALDTGSESKVLTDETTRALGIHQGTRGRACIMQLDDGFPKNRSHRVQRHGSKRAPKRAFGQFGSRSRAYVPDQKRPEARCRLPEGQGRRVRRGARSGKQGIG